MTRQYSTKAVYCRKALAWKRLHLGFKWFKFRIGKAPFRWIRPRLKLNLSTWNKYHPSYTKTIKNQSKATKNNRYFHICSSFWKSQLAGPRRTTTPHVFGTGTIKGLFASFYKKETCGLDLCQLTLPYRRAVSNIFSSLSLGPEDIEAQVTPVCTCPTLQMTVSPFLQIQSCRFEDVTKPITTRRPIFHQ